MNLSTKPNAWDFYNPTEILFGKVFPEILNDHAEQVPTLYITSKGATHRGWTARVENFFHTIKTPLFVFDDATPNPSFDDLENFQQRMGTFQPEQIISLGGGSVMDLGKIFSYVLAKNAPKLPEILSMLTQEKKIPPVQPVPFIAIPTTSGTGSEVTPFSTVWDTKSKKKYSVTARSLYPKKAILCPELTITLPWDVTLSTGLDAFSQALESVWNKNYTPLTGALAAKAIRTIFQELPKLKKNSKDFVARSNMMEASLLSGLCISKTRTAMAHSISYPLTAHLGTSHGIACSFTLPELCKYNWEADDGRMKALCEAMDVKPDELAQKIMNFMMALDFSTEFQKTVKNPASVLKLCGEMYTPGRSENNLRSFTPETLKIFVERSLIPWL